MKFHLILFALCAMAHAGFDLPRGVYETDTLADAVAKAVEEDKPILYLLTDLSST